MQPKKKLNKFWKKFQAYLGNNIPEFIVDVLCSTGYDSALSLADLNDDDIPIIENHVSQKSKCLLRKFDLYSEEGAFEFLPGHRKLLFTLKSRAISFIEENKKLHVETESENCVDEVVLLKEEEIIVLKNYLLNKLSSQSRTLGLGLEFEDKNIVTSIDAYFSNNSKKTKKSSKNTSYKCSVQCVKCDRVIPCTYNIRWETSNIDKHLKSHVSPSKRIRQKKTYQEVASTSTEKSETQTKLPLTLTANTKSNLSEHAQKQLNSILQS